MFLLLYVVARWATENGSADIEIAFGFREIAQPIRPAKFSPVTVRRVTHA